MLSLTYFFHQNLPPAAMPAVLASAAPSPAVPASAPALCPATTMLPVPASGPAWHFAHRELQYIFPSLLGRATGVSLRKHSSRSIMMTYLCRLLDLDLLLSRSFLSFRSLRSLCLSLLLSRSRLLSLSLLSLSLLFPSLLLSSAGRFRGASSSSAVAPLFMPASAMLTRCGCAGEVNQRTRRTER